jgi:hypothetical protein
MIALLKDIAPIIAAATHSMIRHEASLKDMLGDRVIRRLMNRDGVEASDLQDLIAKTSFNWKVTHETTNGIDPWLIADRLRKSRYELSLEDMFLDPIVRRVMERDGVEISSLRELLSMTKWRIRRSLNGECLASDVGRYSPMEYGDTDSFADASSITA